MNHCPKLIFSSRLSYDRKGQPIVLCLIHAQIVGPTKRTTIRANSDPAELPPYSSA